jgi:hypothetical protein
VAGSSRVQEVRAKERKGGRLYPPLFSDTWFRVGRDLSCMLASTLGVLVRGGDCIVMALGTCAEEGSQSPTSTLRVLLAPNCVMLPLPSLASSSSRFRCVQRAQNDHRKFLG